MNRPAGPSSLIDDADLAAAVARQRLTTSNTRDPVVPLPDAIQSARAVGISLTEMQRNTGHARQTIYNNAGGDDSEGRKPRDRDADVEVLMLLAAEGGPVSTSTIAGRARLDPVLTLTAAERLAVQELCELMKDDYTTSVSAAPTPATYLELRRYFDSLYFRRPDAFMVSIRVGDLPERELMDAVRKCLSNPSDTVYLRQDVKRSDMVGPELGFYVHAATVGAMFDITNNLWNDICTEMEISKESRIMNYSAPGDKMPIYSPVLDAFVEGIRSVDPSDTEALRSIRTDYTGGVTEKALAGRCVTQAAIAMRRLRRVDANPQPIVDGETAFDELEGAQALTLDGDEGVVQAAAIKALGLATDHLGYFPAGRLGSFAEPGGGPTEVHGSDATGEQLVEMATAAGAAVGEAAKRGLVIVETALSDVTEPA